MARRPQGMILFRQHFMHINLMEILITASCINGTKKSSVKNIHF